MQYIQFSEIINQAKGILEIKYINLDYFLVVITNLRIELDIFILKLFVNIIITSIGLIFVICRVRYNLTELK